MYRGKPDFTRPDQANPERVAFFRLYLGHGSSTGPGPQRAMIANRAL